MSDWILRSLVMGVAATALLDLWALLLNRLFGFGLPNWGLVGRWFYHLTQGQFRHEDIALARPVAYERLLGWTGHYLIGILFAVATLVVGGNGWAKAPTWPAPILVGLLTVGCGWFILQPGMGAGIAASKKPDAMRIRALNIIGHLVFGFGLLIAAQLVTAL